MNAFKQLIVQQGFHL